MLPGRREAPRPWSPQPRTWSGARTHARTHKLVCLCNVNQSGLCSHCFMWFVDQGVYANRVCMSCCAVHHRGRQRLSTCYNTTEFFSPARLCRSSCRIRSVAKSANERYVKMSQMCQKGGTARLVLLCDVLRGAPTTTKKKNHEQDIEGWVKVTHSPKRVHPYMPSHASQLCPYAGADFIRVLAHRTLYSQSSWYFVLRLRGRSRYTWREHPDRVTTVTQNGTSAT